MPSILQYFHATIYSFLRGLLSPFKLISVSINRALQSRTDACDPNDSFHHEIIVQVHRYLPPGVSEIIDRGGENFIGAVDDATVLKYPVVPGSLESLRLEARLLEILGDHPRIVAQKGLTDHGLLLQRASKGSLSDYISSTPTTSPAQRLHWCKQAAEAVGYIHGKNIIHCDINLRNLLLDGNLDLILADFQGMLKSPDGTTLLDGFSRECSKSYLPRCDGDFACVATDLFALGSAIYFIMTGHEVFPELDSHDDDEEITSRFENCLFPVEEDHVCYQITYKCWNQQYKSAEDVLSDLSLVYNHVVGQ